MQHGLVQTEQQSPGTAYSDLPILDSETEIHERGKIHPAFHFAEYAQVHMKSLCPYKSTYAQQHENNVSKSSDYQPFPKLPCVTCGRHISSSQMNNHLRTCTGVSTSSNGSTPIKLEPHTPGEPSTRPKGACKLFFFANFGINFFFNNQTRSSALNARNKC
jgi:hypothetical protein